MDRRSHGCRIFDDVGGISTTGRDGLSDTVRKRTAVYHTCLGPRQIGSDNELDVPVAENTENHPPEIPLMKTRANLKQLGGGFLLARLVAAPTIGSVPAGLVLFVD